MSDIKIFIMYIFNPSVLIEGFKDGFSKMIKPRTLSMILISTSFILLFLSKQPDYKIIMLLLIIAFGIQLRIAYIGGEHRYWYKQKRWNYLNDI